MHNTTISVHNQVRLNVTSIPFSVVIIPVLYKGRSHFADIHNHYLHLSRFCTESLFVVVINKHSFETIVNEGECGRHNMLILELPECYKSDKNQKIDAIKYALFIAKSQQLVINKLLMFDDNARPTPKIINTTSQLLDRYSCVKWMVKFQNPNIFSLIDLSGIYVVNVFSKYKQDWANLSLRIDQIDIDQLDSNHLYDEWYFRSIFNDSQRSSCRYIDCLPLLIEEDRGFRTFLRQRLRYAYENVGLNVRFFLDLSIIPLGALSFAFAALPGLISFISLYVSLLLYASYRYHRQAGAKRVKQPLLAWVFSPIWHVPYIVLSWVCIPLWMAGGVRFGSNYIRRP